MTDVLDRFWAKVQKGDNPDDCWLWIAGRRGGNHTPQTYDYGGFSLHGHDTYAHRASYLLLVGELAPGEEIHHTCENKICVNPEHLLAVTRREHGRFYQSAQKDRCVNGHALDEANTYRWGGRRHCRTCRLAHNRAWYWRRKEAA